MRISKTILMLIGIFILAFLLRLLTAYYVDVGSDEMIYQILPWNIISAGRLSTVEQAPVYFYLTDIGYKLMGGFTLVTGRLPSIFFGAFAVFAVFLIAREFHSKTAGLIAAFLWAVSGFALRFSQEMDMTAFFLGLLSSFFFLRYLKGKQKQLYWSAVFLAVAVLVKPIVLLLVPAYIIMMILTRKETQKEEKRPVPWKIILLSLLLCVMVVMPVLTYNYLLHKEKGITDYYFSVLAGVGNNQIYQGQGAEAWQFSRLFATIGYTFTNLLQRDWLLLLAGIIGIPVLWKKEKKPALFFSVTIVSLLFLLGGKMAGATHFLWIPLVLSIFAGVGCCWLKEKYFHKLAWKHLMIGLMILAGINIFFIQREVVQLRHTSIAITLQDYAEHTIPNNAIVVLDPRIYRGIFAWAFHDQHYLEGTYFPKLTETLNQLSDPKESIPLYFVECGKGTNCGWKPEDFQRIYDFGEKLSGFFHEHTEKVGEIKAIDTFIIYRGSLPASKAVYEVIDRTHAHWYTPVGWKYLENAVDNYEPTTGFDKLLNSLAFLILYLDVGIALLSPFVVFFLLGKPSD